MPVCLQFAVAIEARANTSIDKMELINAVAKIVPQPHSVDLKNPQKTILMQIVKVRILSFSIWAWGGLIYISNAVEYL